MTSLWHYITIAAHIELTSHTAVIAASHHRNIIMSTVEVNIVARLQPTS